MAAVAVAALAVAAVDIAAPAVVAVAAAVAIPIAAARLLKSKRKLNLLRKFMCSNGNVVCRCCANFLRALREPHLTTV